MKRIFAKETNSEKLMEAVQNANKVLDNLDFYKRISVIKTFDYSEITGDILSAIIKNSKIEAEVIIKKPLNPFSSATAFTKPKLPNSIFIYSSYLKSRNSSVTDIVATLVHEYIHLIDYNELDYDFGHGSNRREGKENSVPYLIESIVRDLI